MALTLTEKAAQRKFNFLTLFNRIQNRVKLEFNKLSNFLVIKKLSRDSENYFQDDYWNIAFENLKNNGICKLPFKIKIPQKYQLVKNLHDENIYDKFIKPKETITGSNLNGQCSIDLDINSEIFKSIFTKETFAIISNYFKKNFWVRNAPCLIIDIQKDREMEYDQGLYHLDHCERQLHIIILINNTNEESTHTGYITKTNQKSWFFQNSNRTNENFKKKSKKYADRNLVSKIIGNSGDVFLFDAGNGLHRGVYGTDRAMIHLIFAQMRYYAEYNDNYENIQLSKNKKHYEVLVDNEFKEHLKNNQWEYKNFKYTSNKF